MSHTCNVCGAALQVSGRASTEHREGPVTAQADARALSVCADHAARDEQLRIAVLAAIDGGLTFAARQRRAAHCGACSVVLDLPMRATVRSVTVEPPDGPPFTLTFSLPVVRCGACGVDGVPPELVEVVIRCALVAVGVAGEAGTVAEDAPRRVRSLLLRSRRRRGAPGSRARPWRP